MVDSINSKFTIGCDPELFLINKHTGNVVPAYYFVKGNKDKPQPISEEGHAIQYDNVMLEFNIPPCNNNEELKKHIKIVLDYVNTTICKPNDLELNIKAARNISKEYLNNKRATRFGCEPDYNAYTGMENQVNRPDDTLRVSGGHIHLSSEDMYIDKALKVIKALDLFLSIPLVLIEPDSKRKLMYGKAGAFRFKQLERGNGIIEYRSPSNYWISSDELIDFTYNQVKKAIEFVDIGGIITNESDIIKAINDNDKALATQILDDYNIEIPVHMKFNSALENNKELINNSQIDE